jgi:hypothetical protein
VTPDELRKLADEATPGPWEFWTDAAADGVRIGSYTVNFGAQSADARLIALAPDLARLCAELGEALAWCYVSFNTVLAGKPHRAVPEMKAAVDAALAKLAELERRESIDRMSIPRSTTDRDDR